jgi:hypothetical protein
MLQSQMNNAVCWRLNWMLLEYVVRLANHSPQIHQLKIIIVNKQKPDVVFKRKTTGGVRVLLSFVILTFYHIPFKITVSLAGNMNELTELFKYCS